MTRRVADIRVEDIANKPSVLDGAEALARVYDFGKHPYFVWAKAPTTRLEEFRASQAPYAYYVEHFSRSLSAVLARVPSMQQRLSTVYENVAEEHGHGGLDGSHRTTYLGYLRAIGVREEVIGNPSSPRFLVSSQSLIDFCLANSVEMGAAAVGIVEYTHIKIARLLAQLIHERFWGDLEAQQHYRLHAEIDADHALALFELCNEGWKHEPIRERIAFAMAYGVQLWWAQFDAMCPAEIIPASVTDDIREHLDPKAKKDIGASLDVGRVSCDLPVRARRPGESWHDAARVTSIGACGLVLREMEAAPIDSLMELSIEVPFRTPLLITGRVRSQPRNNGEFCIEFDIEGESSRAEVRAAVQSLTSAQTGEKHEPHEEHRRTTNPEIGGFDHVGIRVTSVERARAFYELLGFRLDPDDTYEEHRALGLVNEAGLRINLIYNGLLRPSKNNVLMDEPEKWTGITHVALSVKNLDQMMRFLAERDIPLTEGPLVLSNQRRICFVRDPDGNVIEFTERWSKMRRE